MLIESGSMEVEQKHMVVTGWYGRIGGNVGYVHMVQLQRKEVRKTGRRSIFLFYLFFIESYQFVILI